MATVEKERRSIRDRLIGGAISGFLALMRLVPYRARVRIGGWVMAHAVAPLAGYRQRVLDNLALVRPDLGEAERRRLSVEVPRSAGMTLIELFSPGDLRRVALASPIGGPGLAEIDAARDARRPVIIVSGHFGNYDIARAALIDRGLDVGGLYRRMENADFHDIYIRTISQIGDRLFERGRRGMAEMIRHLKGGGSLAILIDQHMADGAPLTFFGERAFTALSAADLALKYDALLVPVYATRQKDGLSFRIDIEAPIPHTTAEEMTQALNVSLEAMVRRNMEQWFWIHRRWRPKKR